MKELFLDREIKNYSWNKLFKKELFEGVRFPEKLKYEDVDITYRLFEKINKLDVLINKPLDDDTKKLLATSLLVGLSERLKKEWNLDYEFVFNDTEMENNNLGSYDHRNKQLYFNKYFIYEQKDWKKGFVQGVDTIFHELKHAQQFQHDISKKERFSAVKACK